MMRSILTVARPISRRFRFLSSSQHPANTNNEQEYPWKEFVANLQSDNVPFSLSTVSRTKVFEINKMEQIINDNKLTGENVITFLHILINDGIPANLNEILKRISSCKLTEIMNMDQCVEALTLLIKLGLSDQEMYAKICNILKSRKKQTLLPNKLIHCITETKKMNVILPPELNDTFHEEIYKHFSSLKTSEILAFFAHFPINRNLPYYASIIEHTRSLLHIMSGNEAIVHLAAQNLRDPNILLPAVQRIVMNNDPLSINRIVTLAHSAATLNFPDKRLLRKIASNLQPQIIHMTWNEATTLVEAFRKFRLEDSEVWNNISRWVKHRIRELEMLTLKKVAIIANAFAQMGVDGTDDVAKALIHVLEKPKMREHVSQKTWMQAVYALAITDALTQEIGETVLKKEFINELLASTSNEDQRIAHSRELLQIQTCLLQKYGTQYEGPRISKATFGDLLTSETAIYSVQKEKYGNDISKVLQTLLHNGIYLLAPKSHIGAARIDERGYFWDAVVSLDENKRFLPETSWKDDTVLRPIILFDWRQRKQSLILNTSSASESDLIGKERMMLRHLANAGLEPVPVFMSDISFTKSQEEVKNLLKIRVQAE